MSNAILIKEVNNQPVIFNVDNAIDVARLEALQAVKMAEEMAADIFGENAQYADILNSSISDNPDNPAFPFTVVFDSSKITAKPKRELAAMAGIAMPSAKYIDIPIVLNVLYPDLFIAPADGYIAIEVNNPEGASYTSPLSVYMEIFSNNNECWADRRIHTGIATLGCILPIRKGYEFKYWIKALHLGMCRFYYAEGTI